MAVGGANRNLIYLNTQAQNESAKLDRKDIDRAREKKIDQKMKALDLQKEAGTKRGNAQDTKSGLNAAATGLGAAAAVCACFPPIGTIIGAILGAIAAVLAIVAHMQTKGAEQDAAKIDEKAGIQNVAAEQLEGEIEEKQEDRREQRAQNRQNIQQLLQLEGEERQQTRELLA